MKSSIIIPIVTFIAGAILVMIMMNKCDNGKLSEATAEVQRLKDSTAKVVDSNNVLIKQRVDLEFEKVAHDSLNGHAIDSLKHLVKVLKSGYSKDTFLFKETIRDLQDAFDNMDTAKARVAIDSLIIEARSANWSATNLFYQYDEMDSVWRLQKEYDDSTYHVLYMIDSNKDNRFNALLRINTQMGDDYDKALVEIKHLKTGKKFWAAIGFILGAATNFLHK